MISDDLEGKVLRQIEELYHIIIYKLLHKYPTEFTYHQGRKCSGRDNPRWIPDQAYPEVAAVYKASHVVWVGPRLADMTARIASHFSRRSKREEYLSPVVRNGDYQ